MGSEYASDPNRPTLSVSLIAGDPQQQAALLLNQLNPSLNSLGNGKLPAFFQNLLPIGLLHNDNRSIELSPAYDIVAYCIYRNSAGHALKFSDDSPKRQVLDPKAIRAFANASGVAEAPLRKVVKGVCDAALKNWPTMIADSDLLPGQKARLLDFFMSRPLIQGLLKRSTRTHHGPAEDSRR